MPKRYKKKSVLKNFLLTVIVLVIISAVFIFLYSTYQKIDISDSNYEAEKEVSTVNEQSVENSMQNSKNVSDVLEEMMESVVGISKLKDNGSSIFSNSDESTLGIGTGVIVLENGYILSNEHVTGSKLGVCYVTLENGKKYDASVVWSDSDLDLSIVKINEKNLKPVSLGDSSKIKTGETVYAIGNPIGFEFRRTVTSGIISSINRSVKLDEEKGLSYMSDLVQTDATINPGNSGGPLIYANGNVIGINTIKITTADGIGFAIPINVVKPVIDSFKNEEKFEQATLGIYAYDKNVIPYLDSNISFSNGIYVAQIIKNGPSDNTDLKEKDIINQIDGKMLSTMNDLREYIYGKKPGDEVNLKVSRGRITLNVKVKLGKKN